jgi:hypothetical protein
MAFQIVQTRRERHWVSQAIQWQRECLGARPNGQKQIVEQTTKFNAVTYRSATRS